MSLLLGREQERGTMISLLPKILSSLLNSTMVLMTARLRTLCLFIWVSPFQFQAGLAGETNLCTYFMFMLLRQDGSLGSILRLDSQAAPAYARSNLTFGPIA